MPPTGVLRDRRLLQPQLTTGISLGKEMRISHIRGTDMGGVRAAVLA